MAVGSSRNDVNSADSNQLAELWNGRRWSIRTPNPAGVGRTALESVSCSSTSACTAVGSSDEGALAERWNGAHWTVQQLPNVAGDLAGVSCPSAQLCVAVGATSSSPFFKAVVARWNGRTWSLQRTPTPPALKHRRGDAALVAVSCPAVDSCMAVGDVDVNGGPVSPLSERWNGSRWSLKRVPVPPNLAGGRGGGIFNAVSCPAGNACIAVGSSQSANMTLLERWNGSAWTVKPPPALITPGTQVAGLIERSDTASENDRCLVGTTVRLRSACARAVRAAIDGEPCGLRCRVSCSAAASNEVSESRDLAEAFLTPCSIGLLV
jgi:hypothetical protein